MKINNMESLLKDFIDSMHKENRILDSLAELGQEKQRLIVQGDIKELDNLIQKEGIIISNLEKLEDARFKLQRALQQVWGISPDQPAAEKIREKVKNSFSDLYPDLDETIKKLDYNLTRMKIINTHNNELIEQSLDYIASIQSMVNGDIAGTYSDKGTQSDEEPSRPRISLLDKKV